MSFVTRLRHVLFGTPDRVSEYLATRTDMRPGYWLATESYLRRAVASTSPAEFLAQLPPVAQRRARAALSGYFQWLGCPDQLPIVPRKRVKRSSNGTILELAEMRALFARPLKSEFDRIVRLIALTACRRAEIGGLRWAEVGADRLVLSADRVKQGREHHVPMTVSAFGLLSPRREAPDVRSAVFGRGERGFSGWSRGMARLGVEWTLHDLRRSCATHWAELGMADADLIEIALGHKRPGIAGVYNRSERWAERVELAAAWGSRLSDG